MRRLAFDFETYAFIAGVQLPPPVCMSFAFIEGPDGGPYSIGEHAVVLWREGLELLAQALREAWLLVGANPSFDGLVSVYAHHDPEAFVAQWAWALKQGRVTDVLLRQKLLDGAWDHYYKSYSLNTVATRWDMPLDKANKWRIRFGELDGMPVSQYPEAAYRYSLEDALATAHVWIKQEQQRLVGSPYFPGRDPLANQYDQTRYTFPITDLASYGLRANARSVSRFKADETRRMLQLRDTLELNGLVVREYKRDVAAVDQYAESIGAPLPRTKGGNPSTSRKALIGPGDPLLAKAHAWREHAPELAEHGLCSCKFKAPDAPARERIAAGFAAQGQEPPMSTPGKKTRKETPEGYAARLAKFVPRVKTDADACERAEHCQACTDGIDHECMRVMPRYSEYNGIVSLLGSPMSLLEKAAREPWHAYYNSMVSTGRTATGTDEESDKKGNAQNPRRKPGVRECQEPRGRIVTLNGADIDFEEAWAFIEADFSAVELHTFSQICYWLQGWSELGRKLNAGIDVHGEVCADIMGETYDQVMYWKEHDEARLGDNRTAGKAINFLRKGAGGAGAFERAAWNQYGVDTTKIPGGARRLVGLHDARTPEFGQVYSPWCKSHARNPGRRDSKYDIVIGLPGSPRLCAGRFFTDAHNYPFQGLASDVAKEAMWDVWEAKWGLSEMGRADPLYQCGMVLFVHDSLTCEVRESRALVGGERLGELMYRASVRVLPNCPSKAEPCAQRQLSKKAKPITDDAGRLVGIWDAWEACQKDARKFIAGGTITAPVDLTAALQKNGWPNYVIEDTVLGLAA